MTAEGKWKLGGMNYAQVLSGEDGQRVDSGEFWDLLHLGKEVVR